LEIAMHRLIIAGLLTIAYPGIVRSEETFVTIHKVSGNKIAITRDAGQGRGGGRGMRAGGNAAGGRFGGRGPRTTAQTEVISLPEDVKITSAMRERRTFEFRVGVELPGGLKHQIFRDMKQPLSARIVTNGNRITELNVITPITDINQTNTDLGGGTVIAVRPKRPPTKK
jgi:hypothetical protein